MFHCSHPFARNKGPTQNINHSWSCMGKAQCTYSGCFALAVTCYHRIVVFIVAVHLSQISTIFKETLSSIRGRCSADYQRAYADRTTAVFAVKIMCFVRNTDMCADRTPPPYLASHASVDAFDLSLEMVLSQNMLESFHSS